MATEADAVLVLSDDEDESDDIMCTSVVSNTKAGAAADGKSAEMSIEVEDQPEEDDAGVQGAVGPGPKLAAQSGANVKSTVSKPARVDCAICKQRLQRRVCTTLKCGHSFGTECLKGLSQKTCKDKWHLFKCVTCGKEFSWSDRFCITGAGVYARDAKFVVDSLRSSGSPSKGKANKGKKKVEHGLSCLFNRLAVCDKLFESMLSSKVKRRRKNTSTSKQKTAWSKGTGFGGGNGATASSQSIAIAQRKENKQDNEIADMLEKLAQALTAFNSSIKDQSGKVVNVKSMSTSDTAVIMGCQYALQKSKLPLLISSLLRNDSLMNIIERDMLYRRLAELIQVLASDNIYCGILDPGNQVYLAIRSFTSIQKQSQGMESGKRKAEMIDNSSIADDDDDTTIDFQNLLNQLNRQCKLFIKQCSKNEAVSKSIDGLKSLDPGDITNELLNLFYVVKKGIDSTDANLRSIPKINSKQKSTDSSGRNSAVEENYLASMKNLQFRMVKIEKATHFYARDIAASEKSTVKRDRLKRITKEMSSLSSSLPLNFSSSIFVRVDETRPDVLKALIIGPEGTPYANGCFVFDIFLPITYPEQPPMVSLITTNKGKTRFNPNLYANGKVCLSLLGTWTGPGWSNNSTLLQVLLSIQSLILVDQPYFNEPGFESRPNADTACKEYNQSLQYQTMGVAMVDALHNTCPEFASVVKTHFRIKCEAILDQCADWVRNAISKPLAPLVRVNFYGGGHAHHEVPFAGQQQLRDALGVLEEGFSNFVVEDSITIS